MHVLYGSRVSEDQEKWSWISCNTCAITMKCAYAFFKALYIYIYIHLFSIDFDVFIFNILYIFMFFVSARYVWELGWAVGLCQAENVVFQKNDVKGGGDNATWDFDGREALCLLVDGR